MYFRADTQLAREYALDPAKGVQVCCSKGSDDCRWTGAGMVAEQGGVVAEQGVRVDFLG